MGRRQSTDNWRTFAAAYHWCLTPDANIAWQDTASVTNWYQIARGRYSQAATLFARNMLEDNNGGVAIEHLVAILSDSATLGEYADNIHDFMRHAKLVREIRQCDLLGRLHSQPIRRMSENIARLLSPVREVVHRPAPIEAQHRAAPSNHSATSTQSSDTTCSNSQSPSTVHHRGQADANLTLFNFEDVFMAAMRAAHVERNHLTDARIRSWYQNAKQLNDRANQDHRAWKDLRSVPGMLILEQLPEQLRIASMPRAAQAVEIFVRENAPSANLIPGRTYRQLSGRDGRPQRPLRSHRDPENTSDTRWERERSPRVG